MTDVGTVHTQISDGERVMRIPNSAVITAVLTTGYTPLRAQVDLELPRGAPVAQIEERLRDGLAVGAGGSAVIEPIRYRAGEEGDVLCRLTVRSHNRVPAGRLLEVLDQALQGVHAERSLASCPGPRRRLGVTAGDLGDAACAPCREPRPRSGGPAMRFGSHAARRPHGSGRRPSRAAATRLGPGRHAWGRGDTLGAGEGQPNAIRVVHHPSRSAQKRGKPAGAGFPGWGGAWNSILGCQMARTYGSTIGPYPQDVDGLGKLGAGMQSRARLWQGGRR